jgi:putative membrane protein
VKLLLRWLISAAALIGAVWIVPGIDASGSGWLGVAAMAAVLGLVNATIRPIIRLLTLPITAMTLGLFLLVINGFTLWLAARLTNRLFDADFVVDGIIDAILGGIIVSAVSMVLNRILIDEDDKDDK